MKHTATHRPQYTPGRRRVPAVIALAMAAGVVLGACSADTETEPAPAPDTQAATSSSSSIPSPTPTQNPEPVPASFASPVPPPAPVVPSPAPDLPAHVVGTGGPCQMLGQVAQADDGSALFCTEDPGGAGPLWLPPAPAGDGTAHGDGAQPGIPGGATGNDATGNGIGQAYAGGPCMQEGLSVAGPEGAVLTCSLTGGGDVPGALYWQ